MAKVTTRRANKDYPEAGIKKGDTYYSWAVGFRGRTQKSKTYPKRSQLTQNEVKQGVYDAYDDTTITSADDVDSVISALEDAKQAAEEKLENMPEQFKDGDTGQNIQSQIDNIESALDELSSLKDSIEAGETANKELEGGGAVPAKPDELEYYEWNAETQRYVLDSDSVSEAFGNTEPEV